MSITIHLTTPVIAHGEEITELTLREPVTDDVIELGLPTLLIPSADGTSIGIELRQKVILGYITRLAAVPRKTITSLSLQDHSAVVGAVMSFFGQGAGETPTN